MRIPTSTLTRWACWPGACALLAACSPAYVIKESKIAEVQDVQCRQTMTTGSHMIHRVCTTRAERSEQNAQAKEGLESAMEYQRNQVMVDRSMQREPTRP